MQLAAIQLLLTSLYSLDIGHAGALRASNYIAYGGFIDILPDGQCTKEVVGWVYFAWTAIQIYVAEFFTGPEARDSYVGGDKRLAPTEGERKLCRMMKMRRSGGLA